MFVDEEPAERRIACDGAADSPTRAEILDQPVEDDVDREVIAVVAPRVALVLVDEAVRLPRDREAQLLPLYGARTGPSGARMFHAFPSACSSMQPGRILGSDVCDAYDSVETLSVSSTIAVL
ncbi:MAG TPA: hypothetical protein VN636_18375 [Acidimicrobiia bacterium]|nr:hypothetical protein [Acidimicrobiia bacterium]